MREVPGSSPGNRLFFYFLFGGLSSVFFSMAEEFGGQGAVREASTATAWGAGRRCLQSNDPQAWKNKLESGGTKVGVLYDQ